MAKINITEKAIKNFNSVIEKASIDKFYIENKFIIGKTKTNIAILINCNNNLSKELNVSFNNLENNNENKMIFKLINSASLNDIWINIPSSTEMNVSNIFTIPHISEYDITINRDQMPCKLCKAEYNNVYYGIYDKILLIKVNFNIGIEGYEFSLIRGFILI